MKTRFVYIFLMTSFIFAFSSCDEDDDVQPFSVNFSTTEAGISGTALQTEITINFSRPSDVAGSLDLAVNAAGLTYGEGQDFYTDPVMTGTQLSLLFASGDQSVSFLVYAGSALSREEDQSITFSLSEVTGGGFVIGTTNEMSVVFSDDFLSPGGSAQLDAGGENFTQVAFYDLSQATQTNAGTYSWDLGFYSETGEFHVTLNSAASTMARPIEKTDLSAVTPQDTVNFGGSMVVGFLSSNDAVAWVDNPNGDLDNTVFGSISATESENPVYIIKRDGGRNWKKVRVLRNGDNYTLQYADIASTTFETAVITKNADFNFTFFDLDNGIVMVEPPKADWGFKYGTSIEYVFNQEGQPLPYGFRDYITINRNDVEVATVMTADIEYDAFSASDVISLTFASEANAIGSNCRRVGPNSPPALLDDRYFVTRDTEDNVYKIRFTSLADPVKGRGFPEFTFELVQ